jgi:hypothetical protein
MEKREKNINFDPRKQSGRNKGSETDKHYRPQSSRAFDINKNAESLKPANVNKIQDKSISRDSIAPLLQNDNKQDQVPHSDRLSQASSRVNNSGNCGGLIKINKSTLEEIIAKNERLSISEDVEENDLNQLKSKSNRKNPNSNSNTNSNSHPNNSPLNSTEYKILFNPNNPDKPIYVKNNNQQKKTNVQSFHSETNYTNSTNNNNRESERQNQESFSKIQSKNTNEQIKINKVQNLTKLIQQEEHKLKILVDSFDSNTSITNFTNEINPMR